MGCGIPQVTCNRQRFFLFRVNERGKVEKREAGDWNETGGGGRGRRRRGKRVDRCRMVLVNTVNAETQRVHQSGAGCGHRQTEGVREEVGGGGRCTRSVHRVPGQKDGARGVPSRKRRTGKGPGVAVQRVVLTAFCRVWRSRKRRKSNAAG